MFKPLRKALALVSRSSSSASSCFVTNRQALNSSACGCSLSAMICCLQPYWKGNFSLGNTRLTSLAVPLFTQLGSMLLAYPCLLADVSLCSLWWPRIPKMCAVMTADISMWTACTAIPNPGSFEGRAKKRAQIPRGVERPPTPCRYMGWGLVQGYNFRLERPMQILVMKSQRKEKWVLSYFDIITLTLCWPLPSKSWPSGPVRCINCCIPHKYIL